MATITATEGDTGRVVGVTLYDDGAAVDLSTADAIECHMKDQFSATVTTVTGLSGSSVGVVNTTLTAALVTGRYFLEWKVTVTTGTTVITYPSAEADRINLVVRAADD